MPRIFFVSTLAVMAGNAGAVNNPTASDSTFESPQCGNLNGRSPKGDEFDPGVGPFPYRWHRRDPRNPNKPGFVVREVLRLDDISVEEYFETFSRPDVTVPLVLSNVFEGDEFDESQWTREAIGKECGHRNLMYKPHSEKCQGKDGYERISCHKITYTNPDKIGKEWAGMEVVNLQDEDMWTIGDFLKAQDSPEGEHLYMFDGPMKHYCPSAMERLRLPKYLSRNYAYMEHRPDVTVDSMMNSVCQPLMIIGRKGSGTTLHCDSDMEGSWSQALSGRKLWRLFPPSEYWRLSPNMEDFNDETNSDGKGFYPQMFYPDVMNPDFEKYPLLDGALMYEVLLEPGEGIIVPQAWAHQVYNVDDAVSWGANILDWYDLKGKLDYWKFRLGEKDYAKDLEIRLWTSFFFPLDHQFPRDDEDAHISYEEYCTHMHFPTSPEWLDEDGEATLVPETVLDFVASRSVDEVNAYRDIAGEPAIVVATRFHFIPVIKYLLDEGEANVNEISTEGKTALDVAWESEFFELAHLLQNEYGAEFQAYGDEVGNSDLRSRGEEEDDDDDEGDGE